MPARSDPVPEHEPAVPAVFVYGTLRPGRSNWPVAAPFCERAEPATLPGFGLYALAYPVVAASEDGGGVRGDILWLAPDRASEALARFDAFEGVDRDRPDRSYYRRTCVEVVVDGDRPGRRVEAWVYVPGDELRREVRPERRVPGDDWPPPGDA